MCPSVSNFMSFSSRAIIITRPHCHQQPPKLELLTDFIFSALPKEMGSATEHFNCCRTRKIFMSRIDRRSLINDPDQTNSEKVMFCSKADFLILFIAKASVTLSLTNDTPKIPRASQIPSISCGDTSPVIP